MTRWSFELESRKRQVNFTPKMPAPVPQSRALYLVIGLLAATLGHGAEQAAKPDDGLLDPAEIGAKRAPAASGGLLDPTTLGAHAEVKTSGRALQPALDGGESPGTGRAMASSVVAALDGLTRACADLVHEMENLNRSIGDMAAKLSDLQFNRIVTMSEYRNGLFCSGCNKTRSQILATGSTFPHQGQKAVEATPQMIADKEKELDGPIDSLRRELQEAQDKLQKVQAERDEALVQIQVGYHRRQVSVVLELRTEIMQATVSRALEGCRQNGQFRQADQVDTLRHGRQQGRQ